MTIGRATHPENSPNEGEGWYTLATACPNFEGRPMTIRPGATRVQLTLDHDLLDRIDRWNAQLGTRRTRSEIVQSLLTKHLDDWFNDLAQARKNALSEIAPPPRP